MCLPSKQWDGADLQKLNEGSKHTQAELAYEINKIWLDNSMHIPLSMVPYALESNQVKYNAKGMLRQAVWPNDFQDYIGLFNGNELALFNSVTPTPHRWRSMGPPKMDSGGRYSWYPSQPLVANAQQQDVSAYMQTAMHTSDGYQDTGRSAFRDYSAWIITRSYETEASTSNEDDAALAHVYKPSSVRMHLCEYHDSDRYPYLSFVQRLLRAARDANTEEIWLDSIEAQRLGLSYESCVYVCLRYVRATDTVRYAALMHLSVEQNACTVMPANISESTKEQIKAKMEKKENDSCCCNNMRSG